MFFFFAFPRRQELEFELPCDVDSGRGPGGGDGEGGDSPSDDECSSLPVLRVNLSNGGEMALRSRDVKVRVGGGGCGGGGGERGGERLLLSTRQRSTIFWSVFCLFFWLNFKLFYVHIMTRR